MLNCRIFRGDSRDRFVLMLRKSGGWDDTEQRRLEAGEVAEERSGGAGDVPVPGTHDCVVAEVLLAVDGTGTRAFAARKGVLPIANNVVPDAKLRGRGHLRPRRGAMPGEAGPKLTDVNRSNRAARVLVRRGGTTAGIP